MLRNQPGKAGTSVAAIAAFALVGTGTMLAQSPDDATSGVQTQQRSQDNAANTTHGAWLRPSKMLVTPARQIIGRDLTDKAGDYAGTITYLMIRMGTGDVIYALASADRSGQFFAVPWDAIDKQDWLGWRNTGLQLDLPRDELREMRRFELEDIHRLTTPLVSEEITARYGVSPQPTFGDDDSFLVFGTEQSGTLARPAPSSTTKSSGARS